MVVLFPSASGIAALSLVLTAVALQSTVTLRVTKPLRYLGQISYGIYLGHMLVVEVILRQGLAIEDSLPATVGVTLLLSAASWHFVECPLRRTRVGHVSDWPHAVPALDMLTQRSP